MINLKNFFSLGNSDISSQERFCLCSVTCFRGKKGLFPLPNQKLYIKCSFKNCAWSLREHHQPRNSHSAVQALGLRNLYFQLYCNKKGNRHCQPLTLEEQGGLASAASAQSILYRGAAELHEPAGACGHRELSRSLKSLWLLGLWNGDRQGKPPAPRTASISSLA